MFPDCDANLVILVKSFVGVRLCLSEPDKEGEGAPGQPCYITFENPDQGSVIQIASQGSVIRIKYEESDREDTWATHFGYNRYQLNQGRPFQFQLLEYQMVWWVSGWQGLAVGSSALEAILCQPG